MKKINLLPKIISALVICLLITSCSSDDGESLIDQTQEIAKIEASVASGTWRVTKLIDSGQDETSDFAGYSFTFEPNGTLTASNGTITLSGTWFIENDNSNDDDDDNDIEFNIFFPVSDSNDFEELNEDWDIVSTSATKIELIDVGDSSADTDRLTFEKN